MTDQNLLDRIAGDSSRRSFLKKGTLASAGLALGGAGSAAAQDEGDDAQQGTQGFMFPNQIVPNAQFRVDAQIDWTPQGGQQDDGEQATTAEEEGDDQGTETETDDGGGGDEGADGGEGEDGGDGGDEGDEGGDGNESALQDQNQEDQTQTYVVQYEFSESYYAFLFVPQETEIEEGQSYQLGSDVTGGEQPPIQGTVAVNFSPANGGQAGTEEGDGGGDDAGGDTDGDGGNGGDGGDGGDGGNGDDGGDGGDDEGDGGLGG